MSTFVSILTGQPPFFSESFSELTEMIVNKDFPPPQGKVLLITLLYLLCEYSVTVKTSTVDRNGACSL